MGFQMGGKEMTAERRNNYSIMLLIVIVGVAYALFYHPHAFDNEATRLDLAFSIALRKTVDIDAYHWNTIDKAYRDGHYYCDKAPGLSLAAAPLVAAGHALYPRAGWNPDNPRIRYFLILIVIAIPSALAAALIGGISRLLSGDSSPFPVYVYALGTLALPYSTLFYDHQFAAALLLVPFYLWVRGLVQNRELGTVASAAAGFLAGYAAISEYPSAVPAAILLCAMLFSSKRWSRRIALISGVAIPLAVLLAYNRFAFGNALRIGYLFESNPWFRQEMSRGIGGVTYPDPIVLLKLLLAPHRGLLWGQPFLMLAVPGAVYLWRKGGPHRLVCAVAVLFFLMRLLINASYYEPYGGFSSGPRFLVGALPYLALLSAVSWQRLSGPSKSVAGGVGLFSILYYIAINAVEPHVPHVFASPLLQYTIPLLATGYQIHGGGWRLTEIVAIPSLAAFVGTVYLIYKESRNESRLSVAAECAIGFLAVTVMFLATSIPYGAPPATASYYMGAAFNRNRQYREAAEHLMVSVSLDPDSPHAWYALGIAEFKSGNYNESIRSFSKSLACDRNNIQARVSLIATLAATGRLEEAKRELKLGLADDPGNRELNNLKATIERLPRMR
jgi:hypothetical protein